MKLTRKFNISFWVLWHSIAVLALVLIPGLLVFGKSAWSLSDSEVTFLRGIALSYLTSVLILTWQTRNGKAVSLRDLILVIFAIFGIYFFLLLLTGSYFSRSVLLATFVFSVTFILLSFSLSSSLQKTMIFIVAVITVLVQFMAEDIDEYVKQLTADIPEPQRSQKLINTAFYNVRALTFKNYIDDCPESDERCGPPTTSGGGISNFDDDYLLATGKGDLYSLFMNIDNGELETRLLQYRIPLNTDSFEADNGGTDVWVYRVTDILVQEKGEKFRLFAAHHYWKSDQRCSVLRISSVEGDYAAFLSGDADVQWQTVYDSEPCLPITKGRRGDRFKGADSGGRMALLDHSRLIFSVGDYQVDGWNREEILAQNDDVSYGKTIEISLDTGDATVYSSGHRNPQGLYAGSDGAIWLTEHGPRGGDELNLLLKGANYGWPLVTYGTEYGKKVWPLSQYQGQHEGFQRPIFSWVPSIAVSNVIAVEGDLFPLWKKDLLIASYKQSLWRLRVREGRVIYLEPIMVLERSGRIRDLMEDKDGRIVLWFDGGSIAILEPLDTDTESEDVSGQVLFIQCAGCHSVNIGGDHKHESKTPSLGPDLFEVAGSRIAGSPGYNYSSALKKLSGTWSAGNLDKYLKDPQSFAPGTKMEFQGITDADERKKIIHYLTTLK